MQKSNLSSHVAEIWSEAVLAARGDGQLVDAWFANVEVNEDKLH